VGERRERERKMGAALRGSVVVSRTSKEADCNKLSRKGAKRRNGENSEIKRLGAERKKGDFHKKYPENQETHLAFSRS